MVWDFLWLLFYFRKALKVVDLKDILTRAGESAVKGNKPDLITKIIGSPAALQIYEDLYGSEKKSGASTTKPAPTPAPVPPASEAAVKETDKVRCFFRWCCSVSASC